MLMKIKSLLATFVKQFDHWMPQSNCVVTLINLQQSSLATMFIAFVFYNILNPFVCHYYLIVNLCCHCHLSLVFQRVCLSYKLQAFSLISTNGQLQMKRSSKRPTYSCCRHQACYFQAFSKSRCYFQDFYKS